MRISEDNSLIKIFQEIFFQVTPAFSSNVIYTHLPPLLLLAILQCFFVHHFLKRNLRCFAVVTAAQEPLSRLPHVEI
jgi:hypothetical protein